MHSTRQLLATVFLFATANAVPVEKRTVIGAFTLGEEEDLNGATLSVQIDNSIHDCGVCNNFAGTAFDKWKSTFLTSLEPTCVFVVHQNADCSDPGLEAGKGNHFSPEGGIMGWAVKCPGTATPACKKHTGSGTGGDFIDGLVFDCNAPLYTDNLPAFNLGTAVLFPNNKLQAIIKAAAPNAKIDTREDCQGKYWYDGETLIGHVDKARSQTTVYPDLLSLKPGDIKLNDDVLKALVEDSSIFPYDNTRAGIAIGSRLDGARQLFGQTPSDPATYLLEGIVQRTIQYESQDYPVCGSGSQAHFDLDINNKIKGINHVWRPATTIQGISLPPLTPDQIRRRITDQIMTAGLTNRAIVRSIDLCFYDSGNSFVQPVFRYNATVSSVVGRAATALLIGYIPASGQELEHLPNITTPDENDVVPIFPSDHITSNRPDICNGDDVRNSSTVVRLAGAARRQGRGTTPVTVGRYVMSHDDLSDSFVKEANSLYEGLRTGSKRFVDSQYYWDSPDDYGSSSNYRVNSVQLAFSDGHGAPHSFITNGSLEDRGSVHIPNGLAPEGFGPGSGGQLAYWVLGECSVIIPPGTGDKSNAFDPWWKVFNGLHAVVGYRDLGNINPNKWNELGRSIGKGASVVHGFMKTMLPTGKTAAVTVCGRDNDNVFQTENLGRPSCLQIWWYE